MLEVKSGILALNHAKRDLKFSLLVANAIAANNKTVIVRIHHCAVLQNDRRNQVRSYTMTTPYQDACQIVLSVLNQKVTNMLGRIVNLT